jgi:hypothetical protein
MDKLRQAFASKNFQLCNELLPSAKLTGTTSDQAELYQLASFVGLALRDIRVFEQNVKPARAMFYNLKSFTHETEVLTCAYLILLLAGGRTGEFHMELELLPAALLNCNSVQQVINIEKLIMEGNYERAAAVSKAFANTEVDVLLGGLVERLAVMRNAILAEKETAVSEFKPFDGLEKLMSYTSELERIV